MGHVSVVANLPSGTKAGISGWRGLDPFGDINGVPGNEAPLCGQSFKRRKVPHDMRFSAADWIAAKMRPLFMHLHENLFTVLCILP